MASINVETDEDVQKVIAGKAKVPKGAQVVRQSWQMKMGGRWVDIAYVGDDEDHDDTLRRQEEIGLVRKATLVTMPGGTVKKQSVVSNLFVDSEAEGCVAPGVSTAMHEYGHRAERVQPRVNELMQTFLARRTTVDGVRTPLEPLGWSKKALDLESDGKVPEDASEWERYVENGTVGLSGAEFARSDGFVTNYVGKQTQTENSSEVFTIGMEGLFAGRYGGLVGESGHRADFEHRDLILGTLATVDGGQ